MKKPKHKDVVTHATPIDRVAARVMPKKNELPEAKRLRDAAVNVTNNRKKRDRLLKKADDLEANDPKRLAARKAADTRMTDSKAEERARRALEAAKWRRDSH